MNPWILAALVDLPFVALAVWAASTRHWELIDGWFDRLGSRVFGRGSGHSVPLSWLQHTLVSLVLSAASGLVTQSWEGYALAADLTALGYAIREYDDGRNQLKKRGWHQALRRDDGRVGWLVDGIMDQVGPIANAIWGMHQAGLI